MQATTDRSAPVQADRGARPRQGAAAPEDDPVFVAWGSPTATGGLPSRQAKYRQVESSSVAGRPDHRRAGEGDTWVPADDGGALRIVSRTGCGNAYLTFAAERHLSQKLPVRLTGST